MRCDLFPRLRSFVTTLTRRKRFEASLDEEIRFHLDAQAGDLIRTGVPPAEAARCARLQFGNVEAVKDDCGRERGLWIVDALAGLAAGLLTRIQAARVTLTQASRSKEAFEHALRAAAARWWAGTSCRFPPFSWSLNQPRLPCPK